MRTWGRAGILAAAAIAFVGLAAIGADDFKVEKGYTTLFNGKDLSGWKEGRTGKADLGEKTEAFNKRFEAKNGVLVVNLGGGIKDLYTVKDYDKDFHLKLEFRAASRADSGVYIRGTQLQVRDYPTVGPYKVKSFKKGDWNELEILVKGTKALCKCNGEVLEKAMNVPAKGGIGLQGESGKFEFRRIRIKELE
jgi:hypothetical protein